MGDESSRKVMKNKAAKPRTFLGIPIDRRPTGAGARRDKTIQDALDKAHGKKAKK